jgi:hypothetical protein
MLLDIREREREAQVNRLGQAAARPAPAVRNDLPQPPNPFIGAFERAFGMYRNVPEPPLPEPPRPEPPRPEPPRVVARDLGLGDDFEWIDNPRTYARCTAASMVLIILHTHQVLRSSPTPSRAK